MQPGSAEAYDRWYAFARDRGVSLPALLDAIAEVLPGPDDELDPSVEQVIQRAREIDAHRG